MCEADWNIRDPFWTAYIPPFNLTMVGDPENVLSKNEDDTACQDPGNPQTAIPLCKELVAPIFDVSEYGTLNVSKAVEKPGSESMTCPWQGCEDLRFARPCELKKHLDKHNKPYECMELICNGLSFGNKADLQRHEREKHGMVKFRCPLTTCPRNITGFSRKRNLDSHVNNRHKAGEKRAPRSPGLGQELSSIESKISSSNISPLSFDPAQSHDGNISSIGTNELRMRLQELEAESKELGLRQAYIEAEMQALKMALIILQK